MWMDASTLAYSESFPRLVPTAGWEFDLSLPRRLAGSLWESGNPFPLDLPHVRRAMDR